jgi:hypothetical protein
MNLTRRNEELICHVIMAALVDVYIAVKTSTKDFPKTPCNKNLPGCISTATCTQSTHILRTQLHQIASVQSPLKMGE